MWIGVDNVNINESVGIIYDAFFYCVTYFNRKTLIADPVINIDEHIQLFHYDSLRATTRVPDPPNCLFPLFYYDGRRCCPMTAYFDKYFDYFNDTVDSFYSNLLDKSKFKKFIMMYYFGNDFDDKGLQKLCLCEGETVLKAATILSKKVDITYYTDLFYHFSKLVDIAIEFLRQLTPFIQTYHSKHKAETVETLQKFMVNDIQLLVKKRRLKSDDSHEVQLEKQVYSVCHLNQYIVADFCIDKKYIFILGVDWPRVFSLALNQPHVTMQSVMTALGHPVKVEIVNELRKRDLTISQLARRLHLARTSISRYVQDLLNELVIVRSRKSGPEIYYTLNSTYLRYAKATLDEFLDQAILDSDKAL